MDTLGWALFLVVCWAWSCPESFGKWLGAVEHGRRRALAAVDSGEK